MAASALGRSRGCACAGSWPCLEVTLRPRLASHASQAASFLVQAENWDWPPQHFLGSLSLFFFFFLPSLSEGAQGQMCPGAVQTPEGRVSFSRFSINIFEQLQGRCRNWESLLFFIDFLKIQTYLYWPVTHIFLDGDDHFCF